MARSSSSTRQSQSSVTFDPNPVTSIFQVVAESKTVKFAVAFWGRGAVERLGLN